jgi:hypothetical protein
MFQNQILVKIFESKGNEVTENRENCAVYIFVTYFSPATGSVTKSSKTRWVRPVAQGKQENRKEFWSENLTI